MEGPMIRHIIFDMGNVLLRFDPELFLDRSGAALRNNRLNTRTDTMGQHFTLGDLHIHYDHRSVPLA